MLKLEPVFNRSKLKSPKLRQIWPWPKGEWRGIAVWKLMGQLLAIASMNCSMMHKLNKGYYNNLRPVFKRHRNNSLS